jgi:hypothetical protein
MLKTMSLSSEAVTRLFEAAQLVTTTEHPRALLKTRKELEASETNDLSEEADGEDIMAVRLHFYFQNSNEIQTKR